MSLDHLRYLSRVALDQVTSPHPPENLFDSGKKNGSVRTFEYVTWLLGSVPHVCGVLYLYFCLRCTLHLWCTLYLYICIMVYLMPVASLRLWCTLNSAYLPVVYLTSAVYLILVV